MVAFSNNIVCLLIGRFLGGAAGSAFLSVAGGTVADVFKPSEVGAPMSFYTSGPFLCVERRPSLSSSPLERARSTDASCPCSGPVVGPIISGFINQNLDWRWTWWILIMCAFPSSPSSLPRTPSSSRLRLTRRPPLSQLGRPRARPPHRRRPRDVPARRPQEEGRQAAQGRQDRRARPDRGRHEEHHERHQDELQPTFPYVPRPHCVASRRRAAA